MRIELKTYIFIKGFLTTKLRHYLDGLKELVGMATLRNIIVSRRENNFTYEGLLELSEKLPECEILVKSNGTFCNGEFDGEWRE